MPDEQTLAKLARFATAFRDATDPLTDDITSETDGAVWKTVEVEIKGDVTEVVGASPVNDLTPNVPAPPSEVKQ